MRHVNFTAAGTFALALLSLPLLASADKGSKRTSGNESADAIVERMLDIDPLTYGGAEANVQMILVNGRNQQRSRDVVMLSRKDGDERRTFIRFRSPSDVAGTAFLGLDDDGDRVQHLFLPALGKTRRISTKQRNASFVGSDYTYADLDNRDIDDSKRKRLPDETLSGKDCYVIELEPTSKESEYETIKLWLAKESYLPLAIRYFDGKGKEMKRFVVTSAKKHDGRWVIEQSKMVDLRKNHATGMKLTAIRFRSDISRDQFTIQALERE